MCRLVADAPRIVILVRIPSLYHLPLKPIEGRANTSGCNLKGENAYFLVENTKSRALWEISYSSTLIFDRGFHLGFRRVICRGLLKILLFRRLGSKVAAVLEILLRSFIEHILMFFNIGFQPSIVPLDNLGL